MSNLALDQFDAYFKALHGYPPYDWQQRLAARAVSGDWPGAIDLPTGSGKTACIDVAIFALACQANRRVHECVAPRRVFFCVNRRVIVDEAQRRATRIAKLIWEAERNDEAGKQVLRQVGEALRKLSGATAVKREPPFDVLELRGGIYRDNRWARSATQPMIVCTTIDQLGSRLLFRGYGVSSNAAPIQAALIAYDSIVFLDEAHISRPFLQTLQNVRQFLDPSRWAIQDIGVKPVVVVPMTATPPEGIGKNDVIQLSDKDRENVSLDQRLSATKWARLSQATNVAKAILEEAKEVTKERPAAVGIIVNRVATANAIFEQLRHQHPQAALELVIGSMRPIDRDEQFERLRPCVGPDRPKVTEANSFIVATQCLEVGADYDFDVLLTECASLDAPRQRFGRLNRAGRQIDATAVIFAAKSDVKPENKLDDIKPHDPIYGNAGVRAWNWLAEHSQEGRINFGIDAFNALLERHVDDGCIPLKLLAPSASQNAPVMLPSYVDFWCQTSPRPVPDPDVPLFIHGSQRGEPDVQVCWRADLIEDEHMKPVHWCGVVSMLPPTSAECMSVPISRLRRWLSSQVDGTTADYGDLLEVGQESETRDVKKGRDSSRTLRQTGVLWRGAKNSTLIHSPDDLRPGDTLVLPVSAQGWNELGHLPTDVATDSPDRSDSPIDQAESAFLAARNRIALRIHPKLPSAWPRDPSVGILFERLADMEDPPSMKELRELLLAVAAVDHANEMRVRCLRQLAKPSNLLRANYPDGRGAVLMSRQRMEKGLGDTLPVLDDGEDLLSRTERKQSVTLTDHTLHVGSMVERVRSRLPIVAFADSFRLAAQLHDLGKADERFQAMLRRTDRTDAWLVTCVTSALLAKSAGLAQTRHEREAARIRAGLPSGFRHEMLSVQLAERSGDLASDAPNRELILHLIAAHHGHARPFAPVVLDDVPPEVSVDDVTITGEERTLVLPHRLDSGIAERFWSLTRRFGWWGLAYLEGILRLADQQASAEEDSLQDEMTSEIVLAEADT
jgi:CRISPR-associated endonuclease/helicase Cas3